MSYLKMLLTLILMMGGASAYIANSTSFYIESSHQGLCGGVGNSTSYASRSTLTPQQPGNLNATTINYAANIGWFPVNFTVVITNLTLNSTIIYPPNGGAYGPAQCSQLVIVTTQTNAASYLPSLTTCNLYNWDGFSNSTYTLNQTKSSAIRNATFNFTIPQSSPPNWIVNCTATISSISANTQNVSFTNVGNGPAFCNTDGSSSTTDSLEYPIVALIILAITLIYFAGSWEQLNPFLAPLSNFIAGLGLMCIMTMLLTLYNTTGNEAYSVPFYIGVFTIVVFCLYLMFRMVVMAWTVLKAVMWR